jgi:ABC-type antimicrobial peptide transport system permease subunit
MVKSSERLSEKSVTCFFQRIQDYGLMTFVVLMAISLFVPFNAHSQRQKENTVFLKNGEVVYGKIVSEDSINGLLIENDCGINLIKAQDIDSIWSRKNRISSLQKTKGFFNLSSLALLFGEGRDGYVPVPSLTMVNGYQFNKHILAGLGIGYEYYEFGVMPLFLESKYIFKSDILTPFVSIKVGGAIPLQSHVDDNWGRSGNKTYGGALFAPEVGVLLPIGNDALILSVGYHYQQLSYNSPTYYWYLPESSEAKRRVFTNYNRISLRVSFLFR